MCVYLCVVCLFVCLRVSQPVSERAVGEVRWSGAGFGKESASLCRAFSQLYFNACGLVAAASGRVTRVRGQGRRVKTRG